MNHFNCPLQGPESSIINFLIDLTAFNRKLDLWTKNIENRRFGMFENVASLAREPSIAFGQKINKHLLLLKDEIKRTYSMMMMHKHALMYGIHSLLSLMISQWELVA